MRNKLTLILLAALSFIIPTVRADIIMPFSYVTTPFYPLFLIVELILFWLLANKVFSIKIGFWKSLLIAFILSVIVEFIVFLLFFIKKDVKRINLFWISGIVNIVSYLILSAIFLIFC